MNFLDSISNIFKSAGDAGDKLFTSDEERMAIETSIQKMAMTTTIELEKELTSRHNADMASDSWLSKNVRPMSLIAIFLFFIVFASISALGININESYVKLLGEWGMLIMSFYFGGRTVEKIAEIAKKGKE